MAKEGLFYEDQARRLKDPSLLHESNRFKQQLRTVDEIVNTLEAALEELNLNKSELARLVGSEPANIRRLFSKRGNPTLRTISDLAFELGYELKLVPITKTKKPTRKSLARTPLKFGAKGLKAERFISRV